MRAKTQVIILHTEQRGSNPFLVYLYCIDTSQFVIYITLSYFAVSSHCLHMIVYLCLVKKLKL